MCTGSELDHGSAPASVADALALTGAGLDYLNSPATGELAASAIGDVLRALGQLQAKFTAAHTGLPRRFDAADAHNDDGYGSASTWLAAQAQMSMKDARADVARMRLLARHPGIASVLAAGQVSVSCAPRDRWAGQAAAEGAARRDRHDLAGGGNCGRLHR